MQHAKDGNLFVHLEQYINKITWKDKLEYLRDIAKGLRIVHERGLIHCDLHGGNIVFDHQKNANPLPYICDLRLSQPMNLSKSNSSIQGLLPYIAPEVFSTRRFTQESDIYAFGILVYQIASGEPPFRDLSFDNHLATRICEGLRPTMPNSTPEP